MHKGILTVIAVLMIGGCRYVSPPPVNGPIDPNALVGKYYYKGFTGYSVELVLRKDQTFSQVFSQPLYSSSGQVVVNGTWKIEGSTVVFNNFATPSLASGSIRDLIKD